MRKKIISLILIALFLVPFLKVPIASATTDTFGMNWVNNDINLGQNDPRGIAATVINIILTLLGIIAVVIVLLGGFKWMTAGGNEDKVSEAKKLLGAGVIGLVIILAAWGISSFILQQLGNATGANGF